MAAIQTWLSPSELQDMLIHDPLGQTDPDFSYGILKAKLRGRKNSAVEFARGKLQPRRPTSEEVEKAGVLWPITAADWKVILAPGVSDDLAAPELLFGRFEAEVSERARSLLVCTTLRFPAATNRHEALMDGLMLGNLLAREFSLTSLLVQHIPALSGSANPMHLHLLTYNNRRSAHAALLRAA